MSTELRPQTSPPILTIHPAVQLFWVHLFSYWYQMVWKCWIFGSKRMPSTTIQKLDRYNIYKTSKSYFVIYAILEKILQHCIGTYISYIGSVTCVCSQHTVQKIVIRAPLKCKQWTKVQLWEVKSHFKIQKPKLHTFHYNIILQLVYIITWTWHFRSSNYFLIQTSLQELRVIKLNSWSFKVKMH